MSAYAAEIAELGVLAEEAAQAVLEVEDEVARDAVRAHQCRGQRLRGRHDWVHGHWTRGQRRQGRSCNVTARAGRSRRSCSRTRSRSKNAAQSTAAAASCGRRSAEQAVERGRRGATRSSSSGGSSRRSHFKRRIDTDSSRGGRVIVNKLQLQHDRREHQSENDLVQRDHKVHQVDVHALQRQRAGRH